MLLKVNKLDKSYKGLDSKKLIIFKNLNFIFGEENIATIYGPSGIGKTTFLNILGTVDQPDSGSLYLNNIQYSIENYRNLRKNHIGYMFQFHYLLPEFTVFENLDLTLKIKGERNKIKSEDRIKIY